MGSRFFLNKKTTFLNSAELLTIGVFFALFCFAYSSLSIALKVESLFLYNKVS